MTKEGQGRGKVSITSYAVLSPKGYQSLPNSLHIRNGEEKKETEEEERKKRETEAPGEGKYHGRGNCTSEVYSRP